MTLQKLVSGFEGCWLQEGNPVVTGLAIDSRLVRPGDLFVAIQGNNTHGHQFVDEAQALGAIAVVVEQKVETGSGVVLQVPCTRRALAVLADRFYGSPWQELRMVGVTGTNGKTSTSYLINAILEAAGWVPGLISTVEYRLGKHNRPSTNSTPEAHQLQQMLREMVGAGCRSAVMEVTSHGLALERVYKVRFEAAVFTNISRDHLDFHQSEEDYLATKAQLFNNLDSGAKAIVNADDLATKVVISKCDANIVSFGTSKGATVRILDGRSDWQGTKVILETPMGRFDLNLGLLGKFQQLNAAAATATGLAMGVDPKVIRKAVQKVQVPGRFQGIDLGQGFGVIIDYAHTPDALENTLRAARALMKGKLICVFGCGGDRDQGKRPQMGKISNNLADLTVVTSDNPRMEDPEQIIRDILQGLEEGSYKTEIDRRQAIEFAIKSAKSEDLILIAGKGHEVYQDIGGEKMPFDDQEVVREILCKN